jgi:hypothetical protein
LTIYRSVPGRLLEDDFVEAQIRDRLTQARVLALEVLEALGLAHREATVLLAPAVVAHLADAEDLDDVGDPLALTEEHLGLTQLGDDLLGAIAFLRRDLPPSSVGKPYFSLDRFQGCRSGGRMNGVRSVESVGTP